MKALHQLALLSWASGALAQGFDPRDLTTSCTTHYGQYPTSSITTNAIYSPFPTTVFVLPNGQRTMPSLWYESTQTVFTTQTHQSTAFTTITGRPSFILKTFSTTVTVSRQSLKIKLIIQSHKTVKVVTKTAIVPVTTITLPASSTTVPSPSGFVPASVAQNPASAGARVKRHVPPKDKAAVHGYPTSLDCTAVNTNTYISSIFVGDNTVQAPGTLYIWKTINQRLAPTTWTYTKTPTQTRTITKTRVIVSTRTQGIATTIHTGTRVVTPTTTSTRYAACATQNVVYSEGYDFVDSSVGSTKTYHASSAYDCCVLCLKGESCGGSMWTAPNICYLSQMNVCPGQNQTAGFVFPPAGAPNPSIGYGTASNGLCGMWRFGGRAAG